MNLIEIKKGVGGAVPKKVVCVGRNYYEHIEELNNKLSELMTLFIKPSSAVSEKLFVPKWPSRYECELSFLIRDKEIFAVGLGLDLTLHEIQERLKLGAQPWERAKAFKNSATFSDFCTDFTDVNWLSFELFINDELRQKADVSMMIYKPAEIIAECESVFGLEDDDIIMTGTPKGVGGFEAGDRFCAKLLEGEKMLVTREWVAE